MAEEEKLENDETENTEPTTDPKEKPSTPPPAQEDKSGEDSDESGEDPGGDLRYEIFEESGTGKDPDTDPPDE